jgi:ribosomal protein S6
LSSNQAEKINVERWGRNPIAYKAKRFNYAHFVCFKYESANHGVVEALSAILRISDNVLKFQTHYINEKVRKFKGNPKRRPDDEFSRESDDLMLDADY